MENVEKKKRKTRGPPPFLRKVYEFVDDPNTNKIISWGPKNESIIIWDQFEFSENILPKYFTHKNFSSFIYQLNSYGFKKIDPDRREYANKWFQAGEKQLLCNIKRRESNPKNKKRKEVKELPNSDLKKLLLMEAEIEDMKREYNEVQIEIQELRKNQESIKHELENNKSKEENAMLDLFLNSFAKSQENFENNNGDRKEEEPMTSDVALLFLSVLQKDVLVVHENKGEEEQTQGQSKIPLELKEMITKKPV